MFVCHAPIISWAKIGNGTRNRKWEGGREKSNKFGHYFPPLTFFFSLQRNRNFSAIIDQPSVPSLCSQSSLPWEPRSKLAHFLFENNRKVDRGGKKKRQRKTFLGISFRLTWLESKFSISQTRGDAFFPVLWAVEKTVLMMISGLFSPSPYATLEPVGERKSRSKSNFQLFQP